MNILGLTISLGPLAVYLMLIGMMNMSHRPLVVSGIRDLGVLSLALFGMIVVGPMELFFPVSASWQYGPWVWLLLLIMYLLIVLLVLLAQRPRINIYNLSLEQLRPILSELAVEMDPSARWAGDALVMPHLDLQLYLDENVSMRNVSLISSKPHQNFENWRLLQRQLIKVLPERAPVTPRWPGIILFCSGLLLLLCLLRGIWINPELFVKDLPDFLRI